MRLLHFIPSLPQLRYYYLAGVAELNKLNTMYMTIVLLLAFAI